MEEFQIPRPKIIAGEVVGAETARSPRFRRNFGGGALRAATMASMYEAGLWLAPGNVHIWHANEQFEGVRQYWHVAAGIARAAATLGGIL